jgi:hypothetical protein
MSEERDPDDGSEPLGILTRSAGEERCRRDPVNYAAASPALRVRGRSSVSDQNGRTPSLPTLMFEAV